MIMRSPSSRAASVFRHELSPMPIIVPPPNQLGSFSGRRNGGEHLNAEGSDVSGIQWSTELPKIVRPNASPLRYVRNSLIAVIAASLRVPSPNGDVIDPE